MDIQFDSIRKENAKTFHQLSTKIDRKFIVDAVTISWYFFTICVNNVTFVQVDLSSLRDPNDVQTINDVVCHVYILSLNIHS